MTWDINTTLWFLVSYFLRSINNLSLRHLISKHFHLILSWLSIGYSSKSYHCPKHCLYHRYCYCCFKYRTSQEIVTEVEQINMKTEIIFLKNKWIWDMNIKTKKEFCEEIIWLTDETRKVFRYQIEERIINEEDLKKEMKI